MLSFILTVLVLMVLVRVVIVYAVLTIRRVDKLMGNKNGETKSNNNTNSNNGKYIIIYKN